VDIETNKRPTHKKADSNSTLYGPMREDNETGEVEKKEAQRIYRLCSKKGKERKERRVALSNTSNGA